jgi:hypothetical protein
MSYYRRFIPKFANLAPPLMELTTLHPKQFKWTQQHDTSFTTLIQIVENTSLNLPDPDKPFYVQSDASEYCGAGRVFQKDKDDNELLLACVLRTFTLTEQKYRFFCKETLALLYCLKSMDNFLRFAKQVILLVDTKSIFLSVHSFIEIGLKLVISILYTSFASHWRANSFPVHLTILCVWADPLLRQVDPSYLYISCPLTNDLQ